jgi:NAD(P)-dependent dehydrogenase (short-subunit alcohol dehydrogenase family)
VILLVGGATGITAEAGVMLAQQYHAHIVAIGRTPMPDSYPYQGITDDASLKRMLFDELNIPDGPAGEARLNRQHARIRRQREIWNTRQRVEQIGGRFSYYEADVTDAHSLSSAIEKIRSECGPIHGLIHGAGVIDDCLIEKKSVAEFKDVYYTKAISVFNLWLSLKKDPLQFAFLFSSLASYTGTPGQTDYVAANEVINEMAKFWNARVPYRVRSLLWSVWTEAGLAGSVVGSAIQRQMARLGLAGISNQQGVKLLHDEIIAGDKFDEWVLLTPQSTLEFTAGGSVVTPPPPRPQLRTGSHS